MKHLTALISLFLSSAVSFTTTLQAGANLLQDPGFETTGSWITYGSAGKVNSNAHTGLYSMRATSGNNGAWQKIYVNPNTTYTLTAWGKKDSTLTYLMIFVKDYGGSAIGRYFTSTSYAQNSITFKPTATSCVIGVWAWSGSGYGYADDFILTSAAQNVWISIRTDGLPGSGTQADPYDGSTPAKFDALMYSFRYTPNLGIHLGPGTFRTAAYGANGDIHPWLVQSGWAIQGSGMYQTTIRMVGSIAGVTHDLTCFVSNSNYSTDNVVIRDLTIDCNWPVLATTAVMGAGGELNAKITAIDLYGSNNTIYRVRAIHSYGSWANHQEAFTVRLAAPQISDATNNVIQSCRAELPYGNHGSPFGLHGYYPNRLITNSKVIYCVANGINDGLTNGFVTGGVNAGLIKNCQIDSNSFTDCAGAYYQDQGSCDGVQVTNNTVIRGWTGAGFVSPDLPKQNITITGNRFVMQNRCIFGSSIGIFINNAQSTNVYIANNSMGYDSTGGAVDAFWTIQAQTLLNSSIVNNSFDINEYGLVTGINVSVSNNRLLNGGIPWGLADGIY